MSLGLSIRKAMIPTSKYGRKSPHALVPTSLTIHNTGNNASADAEARYMARNNNQISFHWVVDEKEAVQVIPETRNSWHAGDGGSGKGNRTSIGLEIARSTSDLATFKKAEVNGAKLSAIILHRYGWGIDKMVRHKDWSGKQCPHRTMELGWERYKKMVQGYLTQLGSAQTTYKLGDRCPIWWNANQAVVKGSDVKELQKILGIEADGSFGPATEKALMEWQKAHGLKADGIFGPDTKKAMLSPSPKKEDPWYKEELKEAMEKGITDGTRPDAPATRAEVAAMVNRATKGE